MAAYPLERILELHKLSMSLITVRKANISDAESATLVLRTSISSLCTADHQNDSETLQRWLRNKTPATFQSWLNDPAKYTVVACVDDEVAGVGLMTRKGNLDLCYVKPGTQGIGIGRALVQALEARAKDWGLGSINLISTYRAKSFYESLGYTKIGEDKHSYGVIVDYYYTKNL